MPGADPDAHGGPDAAGVPLHDFSTNANACGPCPTTLAAVRDADARHYPDPRYVALRTELARFHGVDAARIVVAASASEFIARITAAVAQGGGQAWMPVACYGDYARAALAHGLAIARTPVPSPAAALAWCCDPASPTGQPQPGLAALVDGLDLQRIVCVLDLAYEPLRLTGRLDLHEDQLARVWQLWTPNKALGLTGVRGAYAIAPLAGSPLLARMERLCPSWPLGAHGLALLTSWTTDAAQRWLQASLSTLREWKARQMALCDTLDWRCLPSDANFFCAAVAGDASMDVPGLLQRLRLRGIKLRDAGALGLPGHLRLGVLPPPSQDALAEAFGVVSRP